MFALLKDEYSMEPRLHWPWMECIEARKQDPALAERERGTERKSERERERERREK
jgi:hypothetical protein